MISKVFLNLLMELIKQQPTMGTIDWERFYKTTTKEQLFKIAFNYGMLMADEQEAEALEFLKKEVTL